MGPDSKQYLRLYAPDIKLTEDFWLHDEVLLERIHELVSADQDVELALFDGVMQDRLYKIADINEREAHMQLITDMHRNLPPQDVYLLWAYQSADKDQWIIKEGVEAGVSHFIPLITEGPKDASFNIETVRSYMIRAVEASSRSDIPSLREPINLATAIDQLSGEAKLYTVSQGQKNDFSADSPKLEESTDPVGIFINLLNGQPLNDSRLTQLEAGNYGEIGPVATAVVAKLIQ